MFPIVSQGHGGELFVFFGGNGRKLEIYSASLMTNTYYDQSAGKASAYKAGAVLSTVPITRYFFGGVNTFHPSDYVNQKPVAYYNNRFYEHCKTCMDSVTNDGSYLLEFDGSGLIYPGGTSYYDSNPERGAGMTLLFPSGTHQFYGTNMAWNDTALINHNGSLWMVGTIIKIPSSADHTFTKLAWERADGGTSSDSWNLSERSYSWAQINFDSNNNEIRKLGPITLLDHRYSRRVHSHACDAIGYEDDIYFANFCDVVRYPSCSGAPYIVESPSGQETSKCFAIHPNSGVSNGAAVGESWLLMLNGSGMLKRVNPTNTNEIVDFSEINSDVRTTDNWSARLDSTVNEPCRSTSLFTHNDKLHALFPTATSGYHWMQCNGAVSGTSNWTEHTESLPYPVRSFDGNIFSTVNDSEVYAIFYTMGDLGVWGHTGASRGAGGTYLYRIRNDSWEEIYKGTTGMGGRGILPYQNFGPTAFIPSGSNPSYVKASDYTIVDYTLYDHYSRDVNVSIQYTTDEGINWNDAKQFRAYDGSGPVGSGKINLKTSKNGTDYSFYWDHVDDIGFSVADKVRLRIKPTLVR